MRVGATRRSADVGGASDGYQHELPDKRKNALCYSLQRWFKCSNYHTSLCLIGSVWLLSHSSYNMFTKMCVSKSAIGEIMVISGLQFAISALLGLAFTRDRAGDCDLNCMMKMILPSVLHFLGTSTVNTSYMFSSASATQAIKATEPLFTVMLSWLILGKRTSHTGIIASCTVAVGVIFCTQSAKPSRTAFTSALISSLMYPIRNILAKCYAKDIQPMKFFMISAITCTGLAGATLLFSQGITHHSSLDAILHMPLACIFSGIFFAMYQVSSLAFLDLTDAVTHSVINACKRVLTLAISVLVLKDEVSARFYAGVVCCSFGLVLYALRDSLTCTYITRWSSQKVVAGILLLFSPLLVLYSNTSVNSQIVALQS